MDKDLMRLDQEVMIQDVTIQALVYIKLFLHVFIN